MAEQISIVGTVILMMIVDFKKMAVEFKKFFGLESSQSFPALSIAENELCNADDAFEFNIIADKDWSFKNSVQAYYRHKDKSHEIGIKESVYNKARSGDRGALFTIAHEISHWGLLNHFNLNLGITNKSIDSLTKMILGSIHENMADLLTALLVFSEEELLNSRSAKNCVCPCMSDSQISLALFYAQNHEFLAENFRNSILPQIRKEAAVSRRIE